MSSTGCAGLMHGWLTAGVFGGWVVADELLIEMRSRDERRFVIHYRVDPVAIDRLSDPTMLVTLYVGSEKIILTKLQLSKLLQAVDAAARGNNLGPST